MGDEGNHVVVSNPEVTLVAASPLSTSVIVPESLLQALTFISFLSSPKTTTRAEGPAWPVNLSNLNQLALRCVRGGRASYCGTERAGPPLRLRWRPLPGRPLRCVLDHSHVPGRMRQGARRAPRRVPDPGTGTALP